ncbi:MAG: response regulator [Candidatus Pacebacteria bacterium]|nr:response regulator [Candidatus Paceibacterota bacterium]
MKLFDLFKKEQRVLVVEDDVRLRESLRDVFEAKGYAVTEAGDATTVLAAIGKNVPDAMVLDLILPAKDGITLLEEMRNEGHSFPVVILSNLLGSDSLREDAERLGAVFYNKSSTSLEDIVGAVTKVI